MRKIVYKDLKVGDELVSRCGEAWVVVAKVDSCTNYPLIVRNTVSGNTMQRTEEGLVSCSSRAAGDLFMPVKTEYLNLFRYGDDSYVIGGPYDCRSEAHISAEGNPNGFIKTIEVEV